MGQACGLVLLDVQSKPIIVSHNTHEVCATSLLKEMYFLC